MRRIYAAAFASVLAAVGAVPTQAQRPMVISVHFGPPPLPVYVQPALPGPDYLWMPGFWAWDDAAQAYYWIPGTWARAPRLGLLWTPAWWGWHDGVYIFHQGYWSRHVGFYGGIAYGFGYTGFGYRGGYWDRGHVFYNRSANNIANVHVTTVYNQTIVNRPSTVSYNGGPAGVRAQPTPQELVFARSPRLSPTANQQQHFAAARTDPRASFAANRGRPPVLTTQRPIVPRQGGIVASVPRQIAFLPGGGAQHPLQQAESLLAAGPGMHTANRPATAVPVVGKQPALQRAEALLAAGPGMKSASHSSPQAGLAPGPHVLIPRGAVTQMPAAPRTGGSVAGAPRQIAPSPAGEGQHPLQQAESLLAAGPGMRTAGRPSPQPGAVSNARVPVVRGAVTQMPASPRPSGLGTAAPRQIVLSAAGGGQHPLQRAESLLAAGPGMHTGERPSPQPGSRLPAVGGVVTQMPVSPRRNALVTGAPHQVAASPMGGGQHPLQQAESLLAAGPGMHTSGHPAIRPQPSPLPGARLPAERSVAPRVATASRSREPVAVAPQRQGTAGWVGGVLSQRPPQSAAALQHAESLLASGPGTRTGARAAPAPRAGVFQYRRAPVVRYAAGRGGISSSYVHPPAAAAPIGRVGNVTPAPRMPVERRMVAPRQLMIAPRLVQQPRIVSQPHMAAPPHVVMPQRMMAPPRIVVPQRMVVPAPRMIAPAPRMVAPAPRMVVVQRLPQHR